jgi:uncharacterized SAM-binding protein YcdF (DUF218 family)
MDLVVSKLAWIVLTPGNFLLILLISGLVTLLLTRRRRGLGLAALGGCGLLAIAALPIGAWLAAPLENRFPLPPLPPEVDGIVVLSGAIDQVLGQARGQFVLNEAAERMTEPLVLARRFPQARLVLSGGEGALLATGLSEAAAMRDFFLAQGLAPERLVVEARSRNTWENAILSLEAAQPRPGETWLLVTSAWHMPRAVGCFRRAGWTLLPYPVDYRTQPPHGFGLGLGLALAERLSLLTPIAKEWAGLAVYWALGRTDALLPGPR